MELRNSQHSPDVTAFIRLTIEQHRMMPSINISNAEAPATVHALAKISALERHISVAICVGYKNNPVKRQVWRHRASAASESAPRRRVPRRSTINLVQEYIYEIISTKLGIQSRSGERRRTRIYCNFFLITHFLSNERRARTVRRASLIPYRYSDTPGYPGHGYPGYGYPGHGHPEHGYTRTRTTRREDSWKISQNKFTVAIGYRHNLVKEETTPKADLTGRRLQLSPAHTRSCCDTSPCFVFTINIYN
ncbi:unnamed protein product [Colias eurytheme]|nr:unnamed protein product [Colias eurytheme]